MTPLSVKLRALLATKQIKQGFLAERVGKHPSDISHIMRGTLRPNDELLLAMINELGLSRKEAEELVTSGIIRLVYLTGSALVFPIIHQLTNQRRLSSICEVILAVFRCGGWICRQRLLS